MFKISFFWKSITLFVFLAWGNIWGLSAVTFDIENISMPETFNGYKNFRLRVAQATEKDLEKDQKKEVGSILQNKQNKIGIPPKGKTSEAQIVYHLTKDNIPTGKKLKISYLSFFLTADNKEGRPDLINCWTGKFVSSDDENPQLDDTQHFTIHVKGIYEVEKSRFYKDTSGNLAARLDYYITTSENENMKITSYHYKDLVREVCINTKLAQYLPSLDADGEEPSSESKEEN